MKQEIERVKQAQRPRKTVVVMNLERDLKTELHKLDQLSRRATVFLSYARQDQKIAERIRRALQNHDYSVWFDSAVRLGQDWSSVLHSAIDDAVARGFVLVLLSPASLTSQWCRQETEYALQLAARSRLSSPQDDLAAAEKLINDCGYHRRDQELAHAKKAISRDELM